MVSALRRALEVKFTRRSCKSRIERLHLNIAVRQSPHLLASAEDSTIALQHPRITAADRRANKKDVRRILVASRESIQIAAIPVHSLLSKHCPDRGLIRG